MEFRLAKAGQMPCCMDSFSHVNAVESVLCLRRPTSTRIVAIGVVQCGFMKDFQRFAETFLLPIEFIRAESAQFPAELLTPPSTAAHGTKMSCCMSLRDEIDTCGDTTHMDHEFVAFDIA